MQPQKSEWITDAYLAKKKLPYLAKLLETTKIKRHEKMLFLEDLNLDIAHYLMSIGEEV